MADNQIFHDPQRKRWKRLRRLFDIGVVAATLVVIGFAFNLVLNQHVPELLERLFLNARTERDAVIALLRDRF